MRISVLHVVRSGLDDCLRLARPGEAVLLLGAADGDSGRARAAGLDVWLLREPQCQPREPPHGVRWVDYGEFVDAAASAAIIVNWA